MIHEQNSEQSKVEQTPDMTVKYGKTTYLLHFCFNSRAKQTMNDKVLKLIQANWQNNPNTVQ